jgi:Ni,Fe-hydrogenase III small subunit
MRTRFRHSLGIRHLVCGSCNGCEHEMNALAGPAYDITQHGWDLVASPRHADAITVTGPMTQAMRDAAGAVLKAAPNPKIVIAIGDCAAGRGPWSGVGSGGLGAGLELHAAIAVPGCPPSPNDIKNGIRDAVRLLDRSGAGGAACVEDILDDEPVQRVRRRRRSVFNVELVRIVKALVVRKREIGAGKGETAGSADGT